ncbi:envelope stress response membrane protein PspB [Pacificimonas sp. WHA3]|uniref:Envelope stress response membrane protein PspB n=1 Tax=Pacificimonas pallii TaxID=2827236 RepID=A0ABS6SCU2_9SPHN|nr:envelope stress response membrane protein PspB [Pacificimonas pallii]MBV7256238.1 envelope stress response membrane protein PspB [Pacificimonas pallii]
MWDDLIPFVAIISIFVIFPAILFHNITQWKKSRSISSDDEKLLDDLYHVAHRLDDRINSIERIMDVDNPDWRRLSAPEPRSTLDQKIEDRNTNVRRTS